jgi:hypothetical protein
MMVRGRYLALSPMRRFVSDMLDFARRVPTVPVERSIDVAKALELRGRLSQKFSWCALFLRAYGLVNVRFPELRRAYMEFPRPRLYEHPFSIASVAVERLYQGELCVFFGHIRGPENQTLQELESYVREYKEMPVEQVGIYRRALRISRFPNPLRRLMWSYGFHTSGPGRARRFGTFGLSTYSSLGAQSLHPLSPLSTTLNYGPIKPDCTVNVRIVYDHRVMDGCTIARVLGALEEVFNSELLIEMARSSDSSDYPLLKKAS